MEQISLFVHLKQDSRISCTLKYFFCQIYSTTLLNCMKNQILCIILSYADHVCISLQYHVIICTNIPCTFCECFIFSLVTFIMVFVLKHVFLVSWMLSAVTRYFVQFKVLCCHQCWNCQLKQEVLLISCISRINFTIKGILIY